MGSRTLTHAAIGTDGENFKGEYLSDCRVDEYLSLISSLFFSPSSSLSFGSLFSPDHPAVAGRNSDSMVCHRCRINRRMSPFVMSEKGKETGAKLWSEMMEILKPISPEIEKLF